MKPACLRLALLLLVVVAPASAQGSALRERVRIPAGGFVQGSNRGEEDERPQRPARLPSFRMDRTEVTRAAYAGCVRRRRCPQVTGFDARQVDEPGHPMTGVNWWEAQAYCRFAGGDLPTEAQWEKAARGALGRIFPWGDALDCAHANWGNFGNEGPCAGKNPGRPVGVGSYPAGATPEGVMDLGGNVWEWVKDAYDRDRSRRVVKGGSCCSYFVEPRAANRNAWNPAHRDADLGFRCVYR